MRPADRVSWSLFAGFSAKNLECLTGSGSTFDIMRQSPGTSMTRRTLNLRLVTSAAPVLLLVPCLLFPAENEWKAGVARAGWARNVEELIDATVTRLARKTGETF
jgi:hypothetical protein